MAGYLHTRTVHAPVASIPEHRPALARHEDRLGPMSLVAACLIAYLAVAAIFLHQGGFWSPDSAVRLVQVENVVRQGIHSTALPYPAAAIDPQGRYFPFGPWFHFVRNGHYYVSYAPYFPAIVASLYRVLGKPGLIVLPLMAGLGTIWVTYRVLRRDASEWAVAGALALGLATPLFVYSTVFWDHAPVVFLSSAALGLLVGACSEEAEHRDRDLALSGVLLGCGLWLRNEVYVLVPAVTLAWLCVGPNRWRGILAIGAGLAAPTAVLWAINRHLSGSWLGWKAQGLATGRAGSLIETATGHGLRPWLADKASNAYYQLISPDYYAFNHEAVLFGVGLAAVFAIAAALLRRGAARQRERAILAGGLLVGATALLVLLRRTDISGLLPGAPFLVLVFLPGPLARWERFLWVVVCSFTAGIILTGTHGGLQWGPRYLLPVLPPLVWLVAAAMTRAQRAGSSAWSSLRWAAAWVFAVSLLIQVSGVDQVSQMMAANERVNEALHNAPGDIVVTPLEWMTLGAGPVYFQKTILLVQSPEDFRALVADLSTHHAARWTYVPLSGPLFSPRAVETWVAHRAYRYRVVDDRTTGGLRLVTFAGVPAATRGH